MAGYWIAHVNVKDAEKFTRYMEIAPKVIQQYGGKLLVCGGASESLEGQAFQQHVVIEFESLDAAKACYLSEEYQKAKAVREGAGEVMVTLLESL
ncbi:MULTISPECIES: DUF1330 domain-containing protein [Acinetobacter]|jgi:uncharacterized protein (DUF1330 family)|uniref:DUF1330 domain-containing protein n=1 Tax=Acinetobacter pollinis TaxID=2605270 RepID=A0ABU6DTZ1_9GAMM|nr:MULTISPECIES: DUF1330 domain-containing protein [Acinetobacter]MBF7689623.1 DUF1330 domain-containing protein [Acinetobacter pollinis]MBF7692659.1 DUF1330 domain-containing protein [Acinetobacter pollinis]MBF7698242.1 DUF1330 domain-containing protein [Acinetobacter pollinis]MBF7700651.1 DUF1330 domain-containing protein [Acinetobacter pollinis]MEB5477329.1 DUF1330 domain-containing protein [Acinetobacter pollinis]